MLLFISGQAWWRKIQALGLANDYKDQSSSEVGKWLSGLFGLAFLPHSEVEDSFVEDFMSVAPEHQKCIEFADYLTNTYVTNSSLFPPALWAEAPSDNKRTNNGPEAFHKHYNAQFYCSHPSVFQFLEVVLGQQATTYIKMRNMREPAPLSKQEKDKLDMMITTYTKYLEGEVPREQYVRSVGYRHRAHTE